MPVPDKINFTLYPHGTKKKSNECNYHSTQGFRCDLLK